MRSNFIGDWARAMQKLTNIQKKASKKLDDVSKRLAFQALRQVKEGIRSQNPAGAGEFVALSQRTLKARKRKGFKGTKALLNRGHLLRSIRIKKVNKNEYFIGIHKNETYKTKDGEEKAMSIGAIHEYGKNIVYVSKTGKTVLIHIPARPYLRPVYKKMKKNIEFLYLSLLKKELKLDMK